MTCIIHGVSTKRELLAIITALNNPPKNVQFQSKVYIENPSIFAPDYFRLEDMKKGDKLTLTNHPKRSWFAQLERFQDGRFELK